MIRICPLTSHAENATTVHLSARVCTLLFVLDKKNTATIFPVLLQRCVDSPHLLQAHLKVCKQILVNMVGCMKEGWLVVEAL